jgi:uncharacterized protein YcaQ
VTEHISLKAARRIALAAQGFGQKLPVQVTAAHLRKTADRQARAAPD